MLDRKRQIIGQVALAVTIATVPLAHADARQTDQNVDGLGPTSSQQARITLSVAPIFKPRLHDKEVGKASNILCLSSNVDARTFDLLIATSATAGHAQVATAGTVSIDGSAACVSLADLPRSSSGNLTHQTIIVSPR
ncbi:hypothetical protein D3M59_10880 [Sphingomonas edaphi]|uniref:Uncharacterized protein n=1 Tax=Sphingomonas edaphi TaxID=2315689 RepID=A0A418PYK6_9SPHN|nr:hypothetical protein D3M59_10880 [Sphingomonas edaphi]